VHRALFLCLLKKKDFSTRFTAPWEVHYVVQFTKGSSESESRSNSVQFLVEFWYRKLGFTGASSHSGRRTFIPKAARKVGEVGGSLRDVQFLAGHASIAVTQRYVDCDPAAQRKLVERL
jgi:integrase/recombinase XerD